MSTKLPAFQFYPGDWLRDPGIRACSLAARGLWIEMLCLMHQAEPYGHLKAGSMIVSPEMLSRMVGANLKQIETTLEELEKVGVFSKSVEGIIYSRRMVKDEAIRRMRSQCGKLGGNPKLKDNQKDNPCDKHDVNPPIENLGKQNLTPSVSSSCSNINTFQNPSDSGEACQTFYEAYNANRGCLPEAKKRTIKRNLRIRKRLAENPDMVYWIEVIKKLAASEQARKWASLDWIIANEDNHVKAIEGNYDNRQALTSRNLIDEGWAVPA